MRYRYIGFLVVFSFFCAPVLASPIRISLCQALDSNSSYRLATSYLKKLLEERTQGRLNVSLVHIDNRKKQVSLLRVVERQSVDLALIDLEEAGHALTNVQIFQLPFLFEDRQHLYQILADEGSDDLLQDKTEPNLKVLDLWDDGFQQLPQEQPPEKLLAELQNSAQELNGQTVAGSRTLPELAKQEPPAEQLVLSNYRLRGKLLITSQAFWKSLPEDLKVIVDGAIKDATRYHREMVQQAEEEALGILRKQNVRILRPSLAERNSWRERVESIYSKLLRTLDSNTYRVVFNRQKG